MYLVYLGCGAFKSQVWLGVVFKKSRRAHT